MVNDVIKEEVKTKKKIATHIKMFKKGNKFSAFEPFLFIPHVISKTKGIATKGEATNGKATNGKATKGKAIKGKVNKGKATKVKSNQGKTQ